MMLTKRVIFAFQSLTIWATAYIRRDESVDEP